MAEKFEKRIEFVEGHDCIQFECLHDDKNCKPGKGGSHGRHGLTIGFALIGSKGAVSFTLFTGWQPTDKKEFFSDYFKACAVGAMPSGLDYHSRTEEEYGMKRDNCKWLDDAPCWCDGSVLNSNDAFYCLVNGGTDALWEFLEGYYKCHFEDGDYPPLKEYCKPRRK
jgi:hypothetical protein